MVSARNACVYLWMRIIRFSGQNAEISTGRYGHQTLHVLHKLLVVLRVPEHHAVLHPVWASVCIHHRVQAVTPLHTDRWRDKERERFPTYTHTDRQSNQALDISAGGYRRSFLKFSGTTRGQKRSLSEDLEPYPC